MRADAPTAGRLRHGPVVHRDGTTTFRVWAPEVKRVELVRGDDRREMEPTARGWRALRVEGGHGDDYGYAVDGGEVRPDPASRWLPEGVHGRSRVLDPTTFGWSAAEEWWRPAPLAGAVIYELHVGTFTPDGTFAAAAERLAGLADVGVTHVEVMPVNAFNGVHGWGYDGVAWYAVHEPYGGPEGFAAFVDAAHRAGLAVVLDVVYNHLGPSGNYLPVFGPYLTDTYDTPWGDALNLDGPGSDEVRAFIVDNALQWFADFHVDALRLDAVHGLIDTSAVHLLTELAAATERLSERLRRPLQLIAESDRSDPLTITAREGGGQGLHAQWADDLHHAIHTAVTGEDDGYYVDYRGLPDVAEAYRRGFLFDGERYSVHRGRTVGAPLRDLPGHRLVTCIQNHDQVGNRAAGDRLTALVDADLVRAAAVLLCASPTTPMLFMGEEFGATTPFQYFTSHPEAELADAVRSGRREEFAAFTGFGGEVPDPQDPETVRRSTLDWAEADTDSGRQRRRLWADLLAARRAYAALGNGRRDLVEVLEATEDRLVLVRRDGREPPVLLTANLGADEVTIDPPDGRWSLLLASDARAYGGAGRTGRTGSTLVLAGRAAALWSPD